MLILIPGASGNLGVELIRSALRRGHEVRGLGRTPSKLPTDLLDKLESFVEITGIDDKSGLDAGCAGADAIIVAYNGEPLLALDGQLALLRAAERAGIKRFHAMSWNLDWENMSLGVMDSYDPFISFYHQVKKTSSIKPVYLFCGVLARTLFGVPGAGAMEADSAIWVRDDNDTRTLNIVGEGKKIIQWTTESEAADFSVSLITSSEAENGGFYRFCSDEFTLCELASTYMKVRSQICNIRCVMDIQEARNLLQASKEQAKSRGEEHLRWRSYLGLSYAICIETGQYSFNAVDSLRFPDVSRTSLGDFIHNNDWV